MNVYYDGSYTMKDAQGNAFPRNARYFAWGIVIDDKGEITELSGSRETVGTTLGAGSHETVAFIESALYLLSHGVSVDDVNFTTDDEITAYPSRRAPLDAQMATLVKMGFYTQAVVDSVLPYLEARFHKVRGHKNCVYNLRCDYLAKCASRAAHKGKPTPVLSFVKWAEAGFTRYKPGNIVETMYLPFLSTLP